MEDGDTVRIRSYQLKGFIRDSSKLGGYTSGNGYWVFFDRPHTLPGIRPNEICQSHELTYAKVLLTERV